MRSSIAFLLPIQLDLSIITKGKLCLRSSASTLEVQKPLSKITPCTSMSEDLKWFTNAIMALQSATPPWYTS